MTCDGRREGATLRTEKAECTGSEWDFLKWIWLNGFVKREKQESFRFTLVYLCCLNEPCLGFNFCFKLYVNPPYCDVLIALGKSSPLRGEDKLILFRCYWK